jgi:hypothetical protein
MKLIKGNRALAKELGVHEVTICRWLKNKQIKPVKRIYRTIFYDLDNLFPDSKR